MARHFSLYLTAEAPSVSAVSPESLCADENHPSTINGLPCQLPFSSLHSLQLWICALGGLELSAPWDTLLSLWLCGGKTEWRRHTCSCAVAKGLGHKPGGWKTGRTELYYACRRKHGFDGSTADFLMTSVVSSRCTKNIPCDGDLSNRFLTSAVFDSCPIKFINPPRLYLLLSPC